MQVINTTTLAVCSIHEFRALFPSVSFPADTSLIDFAAYGYAPIVATAHPAYDPATHKIEAAAPVQDGDVWREAWQVVPLSDEELQSLRRDTRVLTRVQFLQRLTAQEWAAAVTSTVPEVLYFVELVRAAQEIDLDDPQTQAGLQVAVQAGVLTEARAGEVLG